MKLLRSYWNFFKGEVIASDTLSIKAAFKIAHHIAEKSWQLQWDNEDTERYTYQLIPSVKSRIIFPVDRNTRISYCRLLLHDTMLKQDSFRTGTSTSPMCDCGTEQESADHFLLQCKLNESSRKVMLWVHLQFIWQNKFSVGNFRTYALPHLGTPITTTVCCWWN